MANDDESKVIPMKRGPGRPRKTPANPEAPTADKVPAALKHLGFARIICGTMPDSPPFPTKIVTLEASKGAKMLLEVGEGDECEFVPDQYVINHLMKYAVDQGDPAMLLTLDHAKGALAMFKAVAESIPEPPVVRWKGEEGYTYRRLPWEFKEGPHPTWVKFLRKMKNAEAFKAYMGSLFVADSDMQQYLWIYGEGNDGKGAINRFCKKLFQRAYFSGQPPKDTDKFWTYFALVGKRLVVFPDCNAAGFVTGGFFKSLTGGDPITIEKKWGDAVTFMPKAKYMFHSNVMPRISSQKADLRRIILCSFDTDAERVEGTAEEFEEALWNEGGAFLYDCVMTYLAMCPERGIIPADEDGKALLDDVVSFYEEEYHTAFHDNFKIDSNSEVSASDFQATIKRVFPEKVRRDDFVRWMKRADYINKSNSRRSGDPRRVYKGLALRGSKV